MVSEAVAAHKKTVVFYPGIRALFLKFLNKHKRFIDRLSSQGLVAACDVKDMGETILAVAKKKMMMKTNEDNRNVEEALNEIF